MQSLIKCLELAQIKYIYTSVCVVCNMNQTCMINVSENHDISLVPDVKILFVKVKEFIFNERDEICIFKDTQI